MVQKRLFCIFTAFLFLVVAGCKQETPKEVAERASQLSVASVQVVTAHVQPEGRQNEVAGTVEAVRSATISPKVGGTIEDMPVVLGSVVKKGDLLVKIDAGEIRARLSQAEARLEQAKRNYEREKRLLEKQASTRETVNSMADALKVATAATREARTMLDYTVIRAPFSGVIARKMMQVGDMAMPGKPMLGLDDNRHLQAVAAVPEALALQIRRGDQLSIQVPAAGFSGSGKVSELAPAADAQSRTTMVKLAIDGAVGVQPGQYVRVMLPTAPLDTLRVPETAVLRFGQMERLFVVANGKAELRLVRTGEHRNGKIEILAGLEDGEQVVIRGNDQLADGQPVKVVQ
jgi:RND family efflux transporter MFP subunit